MSFKVRGSNVYRGALNYFRVLSSTVYRGNGCGNTASNSHAGKISQRGEVRCNSLSSKVLFSFHL